MTDSLVILSARRTPMGAFQGTLAGVSATQLGTVAARAALADAGLGPDGIDEVVFGCVLPAGLGQAPARQAAVGAGIAMSVPATTVNKMCGSGMKAVMIAADQIRAGSASVMLAGGLESMTNAPYLLLKARGGYRMGHGEIHDHMFYDGLQSPWDGKAMGCFADTTAAKYGFSRADQDAFAAESVRRAQRAVAEGDFTAEIAPVTVKTRKGETGRRDRRRSGPGRHREDSQPEAGVRQGRHGDGRILFVHLRRRRGDRARERVRSPRGRAQADRTARVLCEPRERPGVVHDGPRARRSRRRSTARAGRPATSTCTKSTKPSRAWRWPPCTTSACRTTRSTSTAARARWATRSGRRARD